jgi:hypothetical protein
MKKLYSSSLEVVSNSESYAICKNVLSSDSGNISGRESARQKLGMFYRPNEGWVKALEESACLM